jgi:soluble lytic murein transglycosylase-like protein
MAAALIAGSMAGLHPALAEPSDGADTAVSSIATLAVSPDATPQVVPSFPATRRMAVRPAARIAGGSPYAALIARHAAENGVPFALADAVVRIESRYNPSVQNGGAIGLMQIKHQTARGVGYGGSAAGLRQPDTNLRYGMKYLAQAYRMSGGDTCATVMRYQSGHGAVRANGANRAYCAKARIIMARLN